MVRSLTEAQRQATMAANVVLTEAEATKFWPIYREYRLDVSQDQRQTGRADQGLLRRTSKR